MSKKHTAKYLLKMVGSVVGCIVAAAALGQLAFFLGDLVYPIYQATGFFLAFLMGVATAAAALAACTSLAASVPVAGVLHEDRKDDIINQRIAKTEREADEARAASARVRDVQRQVNAEAFNIGQMLKQLGSPVMLEGVGSVCVKCLDDPWTPGHECRYEGRVNQLRKDHAERVKQLNLEAPDFDAISWGNLRRSVFDLPDPKYLKKFDRYCLDIAREMNNINQGGS